MTTIESFLASQTVKVVTFPYPRRASYSKRTVNTWCGWNYCYNLCYISFSKYIYNKNNNSIFNISACLINNQSKLYLVYNVFNLSNHTILLTFEGSIIDNYFFTPNYQMEQFGPNFFVCPQVGVEPTSQTYFVWFYRWATEGCFLFGSLDDITITYSFVKVNRLMIFFSLARRVGFEPTDGFPPPVFRTGAFSRSAISAYYWRDRKDSNLRTAFTA